MHKSRKLSKTVQLSAFLMYTFYKIRGKVLRVTKVVYNLTQEENV